MSNLDRAFENWYTDSSAGDISDAVYFGNVVSDDSVDMAVWLATHTPDVPATVSTYWGPDNSANGVGPINA